MARKENKTETTEDIEIEGFESADWIFSRIQGVIDEIREHQDDSEENIQSYIELLIHHDTVPVEVD